MLLARALPLQLALGGDAEAFLGALVGLQFWHIPLPFLFRQKSHYRNIAACVSPQIRLLARPGPSFVCLPCAAGFQPCRDQRAFPASAARSAGLRRCAASRGRGTSP